MSTPPAPDPAPETLDLEWAARELIPFLELVFGEAFGRPQRPTSHWVRMVLFARFKTNLIPLYEDFPSTMERIRLCLVNPYVLTPTELANYSPFVAQGEQLCIRIFVRHAIRHGAYELYSLGSRASRHFPRPGKMDIGSAVSWCEVPESRYTAIMEELQKQCADASANEKSSDANSATNYRNGSDMSLAWRSRTPHARNPYDNGPLGPGGPAPRQTVCSSFLTPATWRHQDSASANRYMQPCTAYRNPYHAPAPAPPRTPAYHYHHHYPASPYMQSTPLPPTHQPAYPCVPDEPDRAQQPALQQHAAPQPPKRVRPDAPEFVPGAFCFAREER